MIAWKDVYKVVVAMAPLYFALLLGYASVKWWRVFTGDQRGAVNTLVYYFTLPLYTFEFTTHANPFGWNLKMMAADAASKAVIVAALAVYVAAKRCSKESYGWSITAFSLSTLTNSLVVGVPLMRAMYGRVGVDLVVQASVFQGIVWLTLLLFVLEFRRSSVVDLEGSTPSFRQLARVVFLKLAVNPNSYASILGVAWALVANRWHLEMPSIIEGSILILSTAGSGTAMFSMGIFMAQQEKLVACGTKLTVLGMILRFIGGPAVMAVGSYVLGLRGDVLHIAIIQAALPQAITSFIFAKEYELHADVLSTAVIFGMLVSLPVLIAYYAILESI